MSSFLPLATYSHTLKSRSSLQGPLGSPVGLRTGWPDETRSMASSVKALKGLVRLQALVHIHTMTCHNSTGYGSSCVSSSSCPSMSGKDVRALPHDRAGPSVQENEEQHGAMIELQQL
ncbi:unnamed protein product [Sphagnum jensenii]